MEKKADRVFNFSGKVTYIEKQEITVQSGATFYNGPGPSEDDDQEDAGTPLAHEPNAVVTTPSDWCQAGIRSVVEGGKLEFSSDWAAVMKIIREVSVFDTLTPSGMVQMIRESGVVLDDDHMPNVDNIRRVEVNGKFPEWTTKGYDSTSRYLRIAKDFLQGYRAMKQ